MHPTKQHPDSRNQSSIRRAGGAFTLPEICVSLALFVLLMSGVVVANLFGLRWFQIVNTKLLAVDSARKAIGHMADEVRSCGSVYVGNVTNSVFTACANGQLQQGSSLLVYAGTNSTNYVLYFFNSPDQTFRRTSTMAGTTTILASTVTNSPTIFQMQDFLGNVLTNSQNNCLIRCFLQFYTSSSTNPTANLYEIDTAATPRLLQ